MYTSSGIYLCLFGTVIGVSVARKTVLRSVPLFPPPFPLRVFYKTGVHTNVAMSDNSVVKYLT